jgi:signal transduction histidine kinase
VEPIDGLLKPEQELDIYRVAQEALNNALKHANATEITFEVQKSDTEIVLSVFDTGRGFEQRPPDSDSKLGSGLKNLHERAALLGGTLELKSKLQTGTRITLHVPLTHPAPTLHDPRLHH